MQSNYEVYIVVFRFYNLVSLKCMTVFLKLVATFRSFTGVQGLLFTLKLFLNKENKEKIH